ncbi:MAG: nuclear transport factor 2 family protein [Verrucomicrobiota bacterium]|nr:nuclear transport factor 2 family protein [Verrucomicrobiota bacterium]
MKTSNEGMPARFKQALRQTEETRDAAHVAQLFGAGAKLTNLGGDHGTDAQKFWQIYLEQFDGIRSEFTGEIVSERSAALEWKSVGKSKDAKPLEYGGVSIIEFNSDSITAFRTYYDSAEFVRNGS